MEEDNDPVLKFKKNVSEILKTLAYFGQQLQEKSQILLGQNESNTQLDINNLEYVSLGIVNLMKKVKGNMVAIMNDLRGNIKDVDSQHPDKLFDEVICRLDLCQKAKVTLGPDNKYLFEEPCDKETMVDDFEQTEDCRGLDNDKNLEAKLSMNTSTSESYIKELWCSPKKYFNLGLKKQSERCDTEDTNDSWPDSLYRSSLVEDVTIKRPNEDSEDLKTKSEPIVKNEDENKVDPRKDVEMENDFLFEPAAAEDKDIKDPSKSQHPPASPGTDSPSSKISDCAQGGQSNVDTTKNSFLNKATTSKSVDVENSNINDQESNIHIVQNQSSENDSQKGAAGDICTDFLTSPDSVATTVIENNPNIKETTSENVGVEDSDIVPKENDTKIKDESSEHDSEKTVIDIFTDKETVSTNSSTTIIGDYEAETQQTGSVVDKNSDQNKGNEDQEKNHDDPFISPWSVETEKLDTDDENTTEPPDDSSNKNKINELVEEVSMDQGNSRESVDSDETDIVNNSHFAYNDTTIDKVSCHSENFSDVSLSGDSHKSFEFDVMDYMDHIDDIDNCNGPTMTRSATDMEMGDIEENESVSKIFKIEESCIAEDFLDSDSKVDRDLTNALKDEFTSKSRISNEESVAEDNLAQDIKDEPQVDDNSYRDELLELLREVEVPCVENERKKTRSKVTETVDSDTECKVAAEILEMFECESSDDLSDSETTDSNSSFIDDLSSDGSNCEIVPKINTFSPPNFKNKIDILSYLKLKENRVDDCFVSLERLQLNREEVTKFKNISDTSIDRLCDLDNVLNKRVSSSNENSPKCKRLSKRKKRSASIVPETFDSDTDIEITENRSSTPHLPKHLEVKFDDFLAKSLMDDLEHSNQSISSDDETDASKNNDKNKERGKTKKTRSKRELTKEESKKKSWRAVPLLTDKLSSDSDSSSSSSSGSTDSSKSSKSSDNSARNRKIAKYERDSDFDVSSGSDSSSSDSNKRNKSLNNKTVSSTDSSDGDSDVTFVSEKKGTPEDADFTASQKGGRRNIRALMSEESLAAETQRAHKEEEERINRLEDRLKLRETLTQSMDQSFSWSQPDDSDVEDPFVLDFDDKTGEPSIKVHSKLTKRLKPHQRDGIQFMWDSCYESVSRLKEHPGSGCILAHCMGLGKTYQVLALVHTLFSHEVTDTKRVLVVCPLSTVNNWKQETKLAFKGLSEDKFFISTIADRKEISRKYDIVKKWYGRRKGMLVLGYEGFETITNLSKLDKVDTNIKAYILQALVDPGPDLVICDEGHLLRNKSSLKAQALSRIRTKRRIMLTGTPLQNNLDEYYYMVQFVKPNLLGNIKEFRTNFINPIINGQYEDSTKFDIGLMKKRTHVLFKLLKKTIQRVEDTVLKEYLPKMIDHALFIQLNNTQIELYEQYSKFCQERRLVKKNRTGFLADFRVFQYIGTHPQLLSVAEELKSKKIKERDVITGEEDNPVCDLEGWWKTIVPEDASNRIELGTKLVVLRAIVQECEEIGDKMLVFSQSLPELELIEHFLKTMGTRKCPSWQKKIDYCRMDGTIQPEVRTYICDKFNDRNNSKLRMLLMSTKVGGLGLNLTAANRIIIMTVNWNPSYDTQSVFRAYRFGQEKPVYVYRLVSLGTMEEKVYQRTVTKLAIAHRVIDKHQIARHYQRTDLEELYSCRPTADEERPMPYVPEDKLLAKLVSDLPIIFKYHEHQSLLANNPADDLSEQEKISAWEEFEKEKNAQVQPPPPPLLAAPSVPAAANGSPTFSMAYNLVRNIIQAEPNSSSIDNQKKLEECRPATKTPIPVSQSSNATLPKNFIRVRLPQCTTISLEADPSTSTATVPNKNIHASAEKDPLYIPPNNKKNNSKVLTDEVNRKIDEILEKYTPKPVTNIQIHPSNNGRMVPPLRTINRTFNLPNLVDKSSPTNGGSTLTSILPNSSNVPPLDPISEETAVKVAIENVRNRQKRKLKSVPNQNSSKKKKNDGDSTIILVDGDEEEINYDEFSKVRMDNILKKYNKKYVGDIITLD